GWGCRDPPRGRGRDDEADAHPAIHRAEKGVGLLSRCPLEVASRSGFARKIRRHDAPRSRRLAAYLTPIWLAITSRACAWFMSFWTSCPQRSSSTTTSAELFGVSAFFMLSTFSRGIPTASPVR